MHFSSLDKPESLPEGSQLVIKFEDVSRMDAPSIVIADKRTPVTNYDSSKDMEYSVSFDRPAQGKLYNIRL